MEFKDLVKNRYSSRKYEDKKVEKETILEILDVARLAPSAVNFQPWDIVVVDDDEMLNQIKSCYGRDWIQAAPMILVICGNHEKSWKRDDGKDHSDIDVSILTDHITLAATEKGLGTCWVCKFDAEKCKQILNLPDEIEPAILLPIGYPADTYNIEKHLAKRKELEEIVHWNKF